MRTTLAFLHLSVCSSRQRYYPLCQCTGSGSGVASEFFNAMCVFVWADSITAANTALASLCLNKVRVGDNGAMAFADYFGDRRNTGLTNLELVTCSIHDQGL